MANQKAATAMPPHREDAQQRSRASGCDETAAMAPSGMPSSVANSRAAEGELQRRRQALHDVERHRPARIGALAEIEPRHLAEIDGELLAERLVEAVLRGGSRAICAGVAFSPASAAAGSAGTTRIRKKVTHQQAEQRGDHQQQAAQDEAGACGGS